AVLCAYGAACEGAWSLADTVAAAPPVRVSTTISRRLASHTIAMPCQFFASPTITEVVQWKVLFSLAIHQLTSLCRKNSYPGRSRVCDEHRHRLLAVLDRKSTRLNS